MDHRQHDRSPSPARKFWPFNRSRSSSPNTQGQQPNLNLDTSFNTTRSRKSSNNDAVSPSGSASSFVVRSVVRNPGGVSLPTSPVGEQNQPFFSQASRQQSASPGGARRMTLEDSDDDMSQPQQLQYRRSKSKPLGAAPASLSVPAGGPGGGVGYGTARSSNDGRPESANAHQPSPYYRPASPSASMKAGEFQKGAKDRGRSPRKSISGTSSSHSHSGHSGVPTLEQQSRSGSAHSAQSSAANSSGGKKPVARITAGPKSLAQQQQEQQQPSSRGPSPAGARHAALSGPRQFPGGQPPVGFQQQQHYHPQAPRNHSAGPPPLDQRGMMNFPPTMPAAQDEQSRDDPPSRSRRFSFGIVNRLRRDSDAGNQPPMMPAAAPLDGLPSPVDIPFGRSPNSPLRYDNGAETDYSRANSPFGSVSPAKAGGSPNSSGFLSTLMGRQAAEEREARRNQHPDDGVPRSYSPSGIGGSNLAGKWFKGVFGRSPYADEKDPNYAGELNPFPFTSSGGGARDAEDEAAYAQKLASMRQARHIVDEERQRHFMGPTTPTRPGARGGAPMFDPAQDREFRPKQVIDTDEDEGLDAALEFELGRKKSPPGRKPVPAYLPAAVKQGDESDLRDAVRATEEPLTLAQKIIQETRSKQLAREHIEAQRKQAITQQKEIANAPPTPPKTNFSSAAAGGHGQRFPSGAHQITREPAKIGAPISAPGPARNQGGSTLAPGSGPMPMDMPLPSALQEMMIRFYRFERYSVPLIRSLETRLLDIERDSMLANNPQARSASVSSHNSAEMDRWVTQMTSLMKHEVGQLRAATLEIKESRELVANIAKHGAGMGLNNSVSSFGSLVAITPSASVQQAEKARETNVSSSTFQSAVPRAAGIKQASPTKANFGFASESSKEQKASVRDRSVSPNPRPRFTDVLGKPMVGGRLSPSPAVASPVEGSKVEDRLKALLPTKQEDFRVETEDEVEEEEKGDESVSDDIAAALAAIDATSSAPTPAAVEKEEHHIPIAKSASNSSADSAEAAEEPLTPTLELPSHPAKEVSEVSTKSSALPYLSDSKPTSPVKTHFPSASAGSASGRISPTKLFAHKFAATPSSSSATSTGSPKASVKLGLVEKKRFTLPPPTTTTTAATGGMMGVTTVVAARQGGKLSRTPSYSLEEKDGAAGPTSAAFSGLAKVKPVGHTATLRERVAFFDTAK
ncbi:hypothetical protein NDA16_004859 [Ustilago loliicola]|nr:hypothetical protein NDA16_004859 [Ustilago loliicola]